MTSGSWLSLALSKMWAGYTFFGGPQIASNLDTWVSVEAYRGMVIIPVLL